MITQDFVPRHWILYIITYDYDTADYLISFYKELYLIYIKINQVNPKSVITWFTSRSLSDIHILSHTYANPPRNVND